MSFNPILPFFSELLNNKVLLLGETGTGKTTITLNYIKYLLKDKKIEPQLISVLDFAPPRKQKGEIWIGGTLTELIQEQNLMDPKLKDKLNRIQWIKPGFTQNQNEKDSKKEDQFQTPRLSARSADEVIKASCINFQISKHMIERFLINPTPILIINDIGIYLHIGGIFLIKKLIKQSEIVLFNAYYGQNLINDKGSNISSREKRILNLLSKYCSTYLCNSYFSII